MRNTNPVKSYTVKVEGWIIVDVPTEERAREEVENCLPDGFHLRITKVEPRVEPTKVIII